jgi:hypothetical protein
MRVHDQQRSATSSKVCVCVCLAVLGNKRSGRSQSRASEGALRQGSKSPMVICRLGAGLPDPIKRTKTAMTASSRDAAPDTQPNRGASLESCSSAAKVAQVDASRKSTPALHMPLSPFTVLSLSLSLSHTEIVQLHSQIGKSTLRIDHACFPCEPRQAHRKCRQVPKVTVDEEAIQRLTQWKIPSSLVLAPCRAAATDADWPKYQFVTNEQSGRSSHL